MPVKGRAGTRTPGPGHSNPETETAELLSLEPGDEGERVEGGAQLRVLKNKQIIKIGPVAAG